MEKNRIKYTVKNSQKINTNYKIRECDSVTQAWLKSDEFAFKKKDLFCF